LQLIRIGCDPHRDGAPLFAPSSRFGAASPTPQLLGVCRAAAVDGFVEEHLAGAKAVVRTLRRRCWRSATCILMAMVGAGPAVAQSGAPKVTSNPGTIPSESYWTPERMRNAEPFPLPQVPEGGGDEPLPTPTDGGPVQSGPASPPNQADP